MLFCLLRSSDFDRQLFRADRCCDVQKMAAATPAGLSLCGQLPMSIPKSRCPLNRHFDGAVVDTASLCWGAPSLIFCLVIHRRRRCCSECPALRRRAYAKTDRDTGLFLHTFILLWIPCCSQRRIIPLSPASGGGSSARTVPAVCRIPPRHRTGSSLRRMPLLFPP